MVNIMDIRELTSELGKQALNRSKIYNKGADDYAFGFGWFVSDIGTVLDDMNLTKKQVEVLAHRIKQLENLWAKHNAEVS